MSLPTEYNARKEFPLLTVLTAYFPDAIEALVELCKQGNKQHTIDTDGAVNPFKLPTDRVIWDRSKSTEETETAMRHLWDHQRAKRGVGSVFDADGHLHIIKSMWRCAAEAQKTIEAQRKEEAEAVAPLRALETHGDTTTIGPAPWRPRVGDRIQVTGSRDIESTLHWERGKIVKIDYAINGDPGVTISLDNFEGNFWFDQHELSPCA